MKGKPFVIGLLIFVVIVVGIVTVALMSTINDMKENPKEIKVETVN